MDLTVTCIYLLLLAATLQVSVVRVCARQPAMWPWRNYLRMAALVWCAMAIVKKCYLDNLIPPADSLMHEEIAREVAALLSSGRFAEAFSYLAIGNDAYRFFLGVFYALTGASEIVTYAVNGTLGFLGLLALLDILCLHSHCRRLPAPVVIVISLLPSGLLWATANLKEGITLWGICMMLYLTVPAKAFSATPRRFLPVVGLIAVAIMRPHIAAIWLVAIAVGAALDTKRVGLLFATAGAVLVCLFLVSSLAPEIIETATNEGVTNTLADRYATLSTTDSLNGAALAGSNPLPVISGLTLIMFRPWPFEIQGVNDFLVGLEVWALAALGLAYWLTTKKLLRLLTSPAAVTHIAALLALGFYFSYMYNMGLVIRQRLMCFPAVLFLYFYPMLANQRLVHSAKPQTGANPNAQTIDWRAKVRTTPTRRIGIQN
jgi:hypothetical protein